MQRMSMQWVGKGCQTNKVKCDRVSKTFRDARTFQAMAVSVSGGETEFWVK